MAGGPGDVLRVRTWDHTEPAGDGSEEIRFTFNANLGVRGRKNQRVMVMMVLGAEPLDGSAPLDLEQRMNDLGWIKNPALVDAKKN